VCVDSGDTKLMEDQSIDGFGGKIQLVSADDISYISELESQGIVYIQLATCAYPCIAVQ